MTNRMTAPRLWPGRRLDACLIAGYLLTIGVALWLGFPAGPYVVLAYHLIAGGVAVLA